MLAILVFSSGFRLAYHVFDEDLWEDMNVTIHENSRSLAMFAQLRGIGWQQLLAYHGCHELKDAEIRAPFLLNPAHPHTMTLTRTRILQRIKIDEYPVENTDKCFYIKGLLDGWKFPKRNPLPWAYDPSKISLKDATAICRGCNSACQVSTDSSCTCTIESTIMEPLVEVIEDPKFGRGVRVLEKIRRGRLEGEYTRIIRSSRYPGDQVYSAMMRVCDAHKSKERYKYVVSACYRGNWTRFVNHSCNAPLNFEAVIIGENHRIMVTACQDIEALEILTLDYGNNYFLPEECHYDSTNCRFREIE